MKNTQIVHRVEGGSILCAVHMLSESFGLPAKGWFKGQCMQCAMEFDPDFAFEADRESDFENDIEKE